MATNCTAEAERSRRQRGGNGRPPKIKPRRRGADGALFTWRSTGDVSYQVMPFNQVTRQLVPRGNSY